MVELKALSAGYGERTVLEKVDLAFLPGQVTALLGPNGCGKSTLLKTALGLLPRLGGEILYDGVDLKRLTARQAARKAAYLPQSREIPNITAWRMVLHGRFPYLPVPRRYRPEDCEMARQALETAGAWDLAWRPLGELSGGQRQRVYLAMALAQDTDTVFMDEPTTYLDVHHQLEALAVARTLAERGRAVVLVLHDLTQAMGCADRVALLGEGTLAQVGSPEEIYASGALDRVFGVRVERVETEEDGWLYYCRTKEGL